MLTDWVNGLIDMLVKGFDMAFSILPDSPFQFAENVSWGPFGDAIGVVFPVAEMGVHMTIILSAFLGYYAVRWLLRIIRQIQ